MARSPRTLWTPSHSSRLIFLHEEEGKGFVEIGRTLGRSWRSCSGRYYRLRGKPTRGAFTGADREDRPGAVRPHDIEAQIADADRRTMLRGEQSVTSRFFGDPPPGYSALDKRRAQEQRA